eukprot:3284764-Pleurochrysis_carterae.AAC.5
MHRLPCSERSVPPRQLGHRERDQEARTQEAGEQSDLEQVHESAERRRGKRMRAERRRPDSPQGSAIVENLSMRERQKVESRTRTSTAARRFRAVGEAWRPGA